MPKNDSTLHGEQDIRGTSWDGLNAAADRIADTLMGQEGTVADGLFAIATALREVAAAIRGRS